MNFSIIMPFITDLNMTQKKRFWYLGYLNSMKGVRVLSGLKWGNWKGVKSVHSSVYTSKCSLELF